MLQQLFSALHMKPVIPVELAVVIIIVTVVILAFEFPRMIAQKE